MRMQNEVTKNECKSTEESCLGNVYLIILNRRETYSLTTHTHFKRATWLDGSKKRELAKQTLSQLGWSIRQEEEDQGHPILSDNVSAKRKVSKAIKHDETIRTGLRMGPG